MSVQDQPSLHSKCNAAEAREKERKREREAERDRDRESIAEIARL